MRNISSSTETLCDYKRAFEFRKKYLKNINQEVLKLV